MRGRRHLLPRDPRSLIRDQALALGFDAVGFARAELRPSAREGLAGFLAAGYHGDMGWLADKADRRGEPTVLWPEARSVVVLGLNYGPPSDPLADRPGPEAGEISVYARNRDYHDTIKKRLKALARWMAARFDCGVKVFVDTAPVMEKPLAEAAGNRLAGQAYQSRLPRAGLLALPGRGLHHPGAWCRTGRGGSLRRLPALPRCLPDRRLPGALQARCAALHLLSHHRAQGADPARAAPAHGQPHLWLRRLPRRLSLEQIRPGDAAGRFPPAPGAGSPALAELAALDDAGFRRLFAGSPIKRIGRARFLRNVLIAIGNSGRVELQAAAVARLEDEDALVRGAAVWALSRLLTGLQLSELAARHAPREAVPEVAEEWTQALVSPG